MIEMDLNHCHVVNESLAGSSAVNEKVLNSISVLGDRLERLKKMSPLFADIGFSPDVENLRVHSVASVG